MSINKHTIDEWCANDLSEPTDMSAAFHEEDAERLMCLTRDGLDGGSNYTYLSHSTSKAMGKCMPWYLGLKPGCVRVSEKNVDKWFSFHDRLRDVVRCYLKKGYGVKIENTCIGRWSIYVYI